MFCINKKYDKICLNNDIIWNDDIKKWYCPQCDIYFTEEEFDKFTDNIYKDNAKNKNVFYVNK
jgi:hypothetical protein